MFTSIAIFAESTDRQPEAAALANQLNLPIITGNQASSYDYLLILTADFLGLQKTNHPAKPLIIDFLSGSLNYRRKHATVRKEMLARALGLKTNMPKRIIDATAGLARDSFILASLGFEVIALERSPIIFALIQDGIRRASKNDELASILQRLSVINTDSVGYLQTISQNQQKETGYVIYLDPMFPEPKKSALSKQDMRIFHEIIGNDPDADNLLKAALSCATERVVVKRPKLAPPIAGLKPTFSMKGSSNRFDIYLTPAARAETCTTAACVDS